MKLVPRKRSQEVNAQEEQHGEKKMFRGGGELKAQKLLKEIPIRGRVNLLLKQ